MLKKLRDEKEQREQLRAIQCGEKEHQSNPYRGGANLIQLSEFRRDVGDLVADFYKAEAEIPVKLPWLPDPATGKVNLTERMKLVKYDPDLAAIADRSIEVARGTARNRLQRCGLMLVRPHRRERC
jgi:hypothetical protein